MGWAVNPDEAREEAWQQERSDKPGWWPRAQFDAGWDARGRYDEQQIASYRALALAVDAFLDSALTGLTGDAENRLRGAYSTHQRKMRALRARGAIVRIHDIIEATASKNEQHAAVDSAVAEFDLQWRARGQYDQQRIAALVKWAEDILNTGDIGLVLYERGEALLSALGQPEEVER